VNLISVYIGSVQPQINVKFSSNVIDFLSNSPSDNSIKYRFNDGVWCTTVCRSLDSLISMVTKVQAGCTGFCCLKGRYLSLHGIETVPGAHPAYW